MLGSAVKFGRVAEGEADIYPRLAPTSEWDVAAGHALVTAAGGKITDAQGGADCSSGEAARSFIVPEFIAWGDPSAARTGAMTPCSSYCARSCSSAGQRCFATRRKRAGSAAEGIPGFLAAEQIKPLSRDQPEPGVAGDGDAAGQIDRVVAAELGAVNLGMGDKGGAIALVAETPDRAGLGGLEVRLADHGPGVDEIGRRGRNPRWQDRCNGSRPPARWWRPGPRAPGTAATQSACQQGRSRLFRGEMPFRNRVPFLSCRCAVIVGADNIRVGGHWTQPKAVLVGIRLRRRPGFRYLGVLS